MKRFFAILLCLATLITALVSCANKDDEGPTINIYMDETYSFDPALAYNDAGAAQLLSLTYEGLFTMNEKGKIKKALCDDYKIKEESDGSETIVITLKESYWSDGVIVDAADFVYAWNRIMDPEFKCEAASLLFSVKNAVNVKNGNTSRDDIGFYSSGNNEITIELEKGVDSETFIANLASVALYPLRKDIVRSVKDDSWGSLASVLVANGAFYVKEFDIENNGSEEEPIIILERNQYYRRSPDSETRISKQVTPFRLCVYGVDAETAYEKYKSGEYAFTSRIPLEERKNMLKEVELIDNMFTYSYLFNTTDELLSDVNVRKALSIAIDRTAIAELVVYADAADSLVSDMVYDTKKGTSFHKGVISTSARFDEAKKLISDAGARGKSFTLAVADDPVDIAVAEFCVDIWNELGLNANYKTYSFKTYDYTEDILKTDENENRFWAKETIYPGACRDELAALYNSGEFDVIAVNYNMLSTDAFAILAQFSPKYSGGAYDFSVTSEEWPYVPHTSGYSNAEYDKLIDAAHAAGTSGQKAENLHKAEEILVRDDCVVMPLYFGKTAYVVNDNIKKLDNTANGLLIWTKVKDKNYKPTHVEDEE